MKPTDLDDFAPVEPSEAVLARVHVRSRSIRRRRTTQRAVTVVSGLLVVVFAVGIAVTRGQSDNHHLVLGNPGPTTTVPIPPVTEAVLKGAWRPVSITGYRGPLTDPPLRWKQRLSFDGAGHFGGTDACNDVAGRYQLGPAGQFGLQQEFSTAVGCIGDAPTIEPLSTAARVEMINGLLTFFGRDGHELARYTRAPTAPLMPKPAP